jgi:nitrogen fixation protein NifU and related proteins
MLDDLRELYQEVILDHGRSPRNFRRPKHPTCRAEGNNPMCGDMLSVFLVVNDRDIIEDAAFDGKGCAISVASASLMTEVLKGKTVAQAEHLFDAFHKLCTTAGLDPDVPDGDADSLERLQVFSGVRAFPIRVKCATLAWHTMKAALAGEAEASSE